MATKTKSRKNVALKTRIKKEILKKRELFEEGFSPSENIEGIFFNFGIGLEEVTAENIPYDDVISATREALKELFPKTHNRIKSSIMWEDTILISVPV